MKVTTKKETVIVIELEEREAKTFKDLLNEVVTDDSTTFHNKYPLAKIILNMLTRALEHK